MYNTTFSENELNEYKEILKTSKITLQDIVFFACKYVVNPRVFSDFKNHKEMQRMASDYTKTEFQSEYDEFSKKLNKIRTLFAIDKCVFQRNGKHNSYSFTYNEALFIRKLFIRAKNNKIWNEIINIKNHDQLGFVNFYYKTNEKQKYFIELSFFVDGLLDIYTGDNFKSEEKIHLKKHINSITKYSYIKILQLFNQIQLLSVERLLSSDTSIYATYEHYLFELYENIENEIGKANETLWSEFLKSILVDKKHFDITTSLNQANALTVLVDELKKRDAILYANLSPSNFYEYFSSIEKNAGYYIDKCISRRQKTFPRYLFKDDQDYIAYIIRLDLQDAFSNLSQDNKNILSESILKEFFGDE